MQFDPLIPVCYIIPKIQQDTCSNFGGKVVYLESTSARYEAVLLDPIF